MVKSIAFWAAAAIAAPMAAVAPVQAQVAQETVSTPAVPATDMLSRMFAWWNGAFKTPGAYNRENFETFFTEDAKLILEGQVVIDGIDHWVSHFNAIQSRGGVVEVVVPFKEVFQAGDKIYTYHVIRSLRGGKPACSLAAGHATLRDGKLASIVLVRAPLDLEKGEGDPQCWTR